MMAAGLVKMGPNGCNVSRFKGRLRNGRPASAGLRVFKGGRGLTGGGENLIIPTEHQHQSGLLGCRPAEFF